jgi:hypothetical protein
MFQLVPDQLVIRDIRIVTLYEFTCVSSNNRNVSQNSETILLYVHHLQQSYHRKQKKLTERQILQTLQ